VRDAWLNESASDDPSEGDSQPLGVGVVEILHDLQSRARTFFLSRTLIVDAHDALGVREIGHLGRSSEERQWSIDLGHGRDVDGAQMHCTAVTVCNTLRQSRKDDGLIPEIGIRSAEAGFDRVDVSAPLGLRPTAFHEFDDLLLIHVSYSLSCVSNVETISKYHELDILSIQPRSNDSILKLILTIMSQIVLAESLVQFRIQGFRKGTTDVPNWSHSFRVRDLLVRHGYSEEICLAGLLHDIVEDGGVTFDELKGHGFSDRAIQLVDLCSHDSSLPEGDGRWVKMLSRLVDVADKDAWAIKIADLTDNLQSCHTMSEERQRFMYQTKGPLLLSLTWNLMGETDLWNGLKEQLKQRPS